MMCLTRAWKIVSSVNSQSCKTYQVYFYLQRLSLALYQGRLDALEPKLSIVWMPGCRSKSFEPITVLLVLAIYQFWNKINSPYWKKLLMINESIVFLGYRSLDTSNTLPICMIPTVVIVWQKLIIMKENYFPMAKKVTQPLTLMLIYVL